MKVVGLLVLSVAVLSLGCYGKIKPKYVAAPNAQHASAQVQRKDTTATQPRRTRNANGATVEQVIPRVPIQINAENISVVIRITNVPGAPRDFVFYVPCFTDGGCQAQPIPGSGALVLPSGDVIAPPNDMPSSYSKLWTPPPGAI